MPAVWHCVHLLYAWSLSGAGSARGANHEVGVEELGLVVAEGAAVPGAHDFAAGGAYHGVGGGGVPLAGGGEAWVDVGTAFGYAADFQATSGLCETEVGVYCS